MMNKTSKLLVNVVDKKYLCLVTRIDTIRSGRRRRGLRLSKTVRNQVIRDRHVIFWDRPIDLKLFNSVLDIKSNLREVFFKGGNRIPHHLINLLTNMLLFTQRC
eukprot:TRINITY_DN4039_c0_g1_i2.p1 TRINITY_DN4039_c0_g1~~TRINITY_DN4039_c0_g1_i2.p1  ORF type:complete len:104 (-),score=2.60 TRINITY_DN4039_c0_g1_i2:453-764(-)